MCSEKDGWTGCPWGSAAGESATAFWANLSESGSNALVRGAAAVAGVFSALWTPQTATSTGLTLASVAPFGQVFGTFTHFGYSDAAASLANGLREGSYATNRFTSIESGAEAVEKLALPERLVPPDAAYRVTPDWWQYVEGPTRVSPANGQPGGGWEYFFPKGTGPGTVSGPWPIIP